MKSRRCFHPSPKNPETHQTHPTRTTLLLFLNLSIKTHRVCAAVRPAPLQTAPPPAPPQTAPPIASTRRRAFTWAAAGSLTVLIRLIELRSIRPTEVLNEMTHGARTGPVLSRFSPTQHGYCKLSHGWGTRGCLRWLCRARWCSCCP